MRELEEKRQKNQEDGSINGFTFDQLDSNEDRVISKQEWDQAMRRNRARPQGSRVKAPIALGGQNDTSSPEMQDSEKLRKEFDRMDRNHDGRIDRDEFGFARLDTDHNGEISREEYAKVPTLAPTVQSPVCTEAHRRQPWSLWCIRRPAQREYGCSADLNAHRAMGKGQVTTSTESTLTTTIRSTWTSSDGTGDRSDCPGKGAIRTAPCPRRWAPLWMTTSGRSLRAI